MIVSLHDHKVHMTTMENRYKWSQQEGYCGFGFSVGVLEACGLAWGLAMGCRCMEDMMMDFWAWRTAPRVVMILASQGIFPLSVLGACPVGS